MNQATEAFQRLLTIMNELREKCPWDKKQTMESLRHLSIEELYELSDAILESDREEIKKELGDVMMHLVFYAKIASENGWFEMKDVLDSVCEKLIYRHPHIYGDVMVKDEHEVKQNWEQLKLKEKGANGEKKKSVLQGVPASLPALVKAFRIQEKVAAVGFDWTAKEQVWAKVEEELAEFKAEKSLVENRNQEHIEGEFGDLLFSLINYGRFLNINAEDALEKTNRKFIRRFNYIEERAADAGIALAPGKLTEMDAWWNEAKKLSL